MERTTKNGETFILVPEAYFDTLVHDAEMLHDVKAFGRAMSRLEVGEETFPQALGVALSGAAERGESLIPVWRKYRGLTQTALATKSGVSLVYLSEIETGRKPGSIAALKAIAAALGLDLDDLV